MKIGDWAFEDSGLTELKFAKGFTGEIRDSAFANSGLTSLEFDEDFTGEIGSGAFMGRDPKKLEDEVDEEEETPGYEWMSNLKSVTIPKGTTKIGKGAFRWSALTELTFAKGFTGEVEKTAFWGTEQLTSVKMHHSSFTKLCKPGSDANFMVCEIYRDTVYKATPYRMRDDW